MEPSTLRIGIERLHKNFAPKKYGAESLQILVQELSGEPDNCVKPAVDKLLMEYSILPPLTKLVQYVRDAASASREIDAERTKHAFKSVFDVEPCTEYGRECLRLLRGLFDGRMEYLDYLKGCFSNMDKNGVCDQDLALWVKSEWESHGAD